MKERETKTFDTTTPTLAKYSTYPLNMFLYVEQNVSEIEIFHYGRVRMVMVRESFGQMPYVSLVIEPTDPPVRFALRHPNDNITIETGWKHEGPIKIRQYIEPP